MVKFAHLSDCHLGCWRQEELQRLNFESFQKIINKSIEEKVDFILIAGDLFDSAYPPIEILKDTFAEFKKIFDSRIPVYLISGSHDFSASGKTFLDVIEKAGFCKNVENYTIQEDGRIKLNPSFYGDIAIYGYPGKKSGMEMEDLKKVYFDEIHQFIIFMIHTTIKDVVGTIPMDFIEKEKLPLANYYAMGHIHKRFEEKIRNSCYVYPGPTFPANFQELVDLKCGTFKIVEIDGEDVKTREIRIHTKEVAYLELELDNGLTATQKIISEVDKLNLRDKIFLLRLKGVLIEGKMGDIRFNEIEDFVKKKEAYVFLRNISSIKMQDLEIEIEEEMGNVENIEKRIIGEYSRKNPANFNKYLSQLLSVLSLEKNEDERSVIYENRLISELKNVLELQNKI
jgi:DNA repair exonuclease SbcCD nuclease subunit